MNDLEKKTLLTYGVKNSLSKSLEKDIDSLKPNVKSIVRTNGNKVSEKSTQVVVEGDVGDGLVRKFQFTLQKKVSTSLVSDFAVRARKEPAVLEATDIKIVLPINTLRNLVQDKDTLNKIMEYRKGYSIDGERFSVLVSEGKLEEPESYFTDSVTEALTVKEVR